MNLWPQRANTASESLEILDEVAKWLRSRNVQGQWPSSFTAPSPGDVPRDRVTEIKRYAYDGQLWVLRDGRLGDTAVATFAVSERPDPDFAASWPGGPGDARYMYRMAVRRIACGQGVGGLCVDLALWLARAAGVSWLRLDCSKSNTALHAYYERLGFTRVGTAEVPGRLSGALFERPVR